MKRDKYICAATIGGTIDLIDTTSLQVVKTLETSTAQINDMDARNGYLVTCGWVNRAQGRQLSTLANVYDLRTMTQLSPIPAHAGAAFAQMHPKMSSTCILCSQHGNLQTVDLMNPSSAMPLNQAALANFVSGLVVAPSGDAMAVLDGGQFVILRGGSLQVQFTEYIKHPLAWGDTPQTLPQIDIDDTSMSVNSLSHLSTMNTDRVPDLLVKLECRIIGSVYYLHGPMK